MKRAALITFAFIAALPAPALANGDAEARALATCAWQNVPQTARVLVEVRPRSNTIYDSVESTRSAPYMRAYAACLAEKQALETKVDTSEVSYRFLQALRRSEPSEVGQDRFYERVFRCEARFADYATADGPAMVWWGFGEDQFVEQLGAQSQIFNSQIVFTPADIEAVNRRGDGLQNLLSLLDQSKDQNIVEVETYAEGQQSNAAFKIKPTSENSTCQFVTPEGELIDA